jgi:hypothetical protein
MISARTDTFCLPLLECLLVVVVVKFFLLEETTLEEQDSKAEDDDAIDVVICSLCVFS